MEDSRREALLVTIADWDRAMVTNDPEKIGKYMDEGWTIIGSTGDVVDKGRFLALLEAHELSHHTMESHDVAVRLYGDAAIVIARGISAGRFRGQPFHVVERVSCMFVWQRERWQCVSTHLSGLRKDDRPAGPDSAEGEEE